MTNRGCRLMGSAFVAAAGCVTAGISELATATSFHYYSGLAGVVGGTTLLSGGCLFAIDWVTSFRTDIKSEASQREY